jgi:hypothetical protein
MPPYTLSPLCAGRENSGGRGRKNGGLQLTAGGASLI